LDSSQGLDFAPLKKLMQRVAQAGQRATGGSGAPVDAAPGQAGTAAVIATGAIASREDAIRALERACEWIERNEPSNPAPLLVRRAQRLMSKNFIDIIRDLVPDGLGQVEKLAGTGKS
jgi:type VI secretion system protein ImpA